VRDVIEQVMKVQGKWMEHFDAKFDWWWKMEDGCWKMEELCETLWLTLCDFVLHKNCKMVYAEIVSIPQKAVIQL
jgi:hypothetical protein